MGRNGKHYIDEFKKQIVALRKNGKTIGDISKEYNVAKSTINKCVSDYEIQALLKLKIIAVNQKMK